jgi:hypothetical protein
MMRAAATEMLKDSTKPAEAGGSRVDDCDGTQPFSGAYWVMQQMACECARLTDKPTSHHITNQPWFGTAACTATRPLHDPGATLLGLVVPSAYRNHTFAWPHAFPCPPKLAAACCGTPTMHSPPVMGTTMVASANCTASWDTPDFSLPSTNAVGCVQSQSWRQQHRQYTCILGGTSGMPCVRVPVGMQQTPWADC